MLIEVRPGEGGKEAESYADEVFDALVSVARRSGFEPHGMRRAPRLRTFSTKGPESLSALAGTHRVQRIPAGAQARHTSTCTVAVLDQTATADRH